MNTPPSKQDLLAPVEDASGAPVPPGFSEALGEVRIALARCDDAGFPEATVLAALVTELLPRLVMLYGADSAAAMLRNFAEEIMATDGQSRPAP